jgi:hypothetical protein
MEMTSTSLSAFYWVLSLGALLLVLAIVRPVWGKVTGALIVIVLFGYRPVTLVLEHEKSADIRRAATAHFERRCRSAGEKITRTVEGVEGILLMKLRPKSSPSNWADQYWIGDPYGDEVGGNGYIETFLKYLTEDGAPVTYKTPRIGYRYVEAADPVDGRRYRYTLRMDKKFPEPQFDKTPSQGPAPHYGVTWVDISTPEDRKVWVAGGSLKVIDLHTNEVIAERIGYVFDTGQGNTSGGRLPWKFAQSYSACPKISRPSSVQTRPFVEKVLKPKKGEEQ